MHLNPKTPAALKVMVHGDEMVALPQNGWLALPLDETLWLIPVGTNWMESPTWLVMRAGEKEKPPPGPTITVVVAPKQQGAIMKPENMARSPVV